MKRVGQYISYFFYIGVNWNFRLALFLIKHEVRGERKYNLNTCTINNLKTSVPEPLLRHASIYQPVNFFIAEWLFAQVPENLKQTVFADIGCGMGRVLVMALYKGFKKVEGIDVSPEMCNHAIAILDDKIKDISGSSFCIACDNAENHPINEDVGVIFLFNPFDEFIMKGLIGQVIQSLLKKPREMMVLYSSPMHKNLWLNAGFRETCSTKKLKWLEGSVLFINPTA